MVESDSIYTPVIPRSAFRQGEIITSLTQFRVGLGSITDALSGQRAAIEPIVHPFAVVMTQTCDLERDHQARIGEPDASKLLPSVLFCDAQEAEVVESKRVVNKGTQWNMLVRNKMERFQFLQRVPVDADTANEGLPELVLDFKHYFTVPTDELNAQVEVKAIRRCRLKSPYCEHLAARFSYFQARVALPSDHESE